MSYLVQQYKVIINWSKRDGHYIAQVPELPGCIADGSSYTETVKNIDEVITSWLETARDFKREIPVPS
ncbi:MAG: type II toxin-antitoxin system HicB family antitoxin [Leptospirales bacterium]